MPRLTIVFGLVICIACPLLAIIGIGSMHFMPGCIGGSSGPAAGCILFGLNFNWLVQLGTVCFLGTFFAVPLGVLVILCGAAMQWLDGRSKPKRG